MTVYKSDKLIFEIEDVIKQKLTAKQKSVMQKAIRKYFIEVHKEACEATLMSINKHNYKLPNFED